MIVPASLHLHTSGDVIPPSLQKEDPNQGQENPMLQSSLPGMRKRNMASLGVCIASYLPSSYTYSISSSLNISRPTPRLQNLLQILPAVLVCSLMVVQLLLQVCDLSRGLRALAGETLVDRINGDIDEPISRNQLLHISMETSPLQGAGKLTSFQHPRTPESRKAGPKAPST